MIVEHKGVIKYRLEKFDTTERGATKYGVKLCILDQNEKLRNNGSRLVSLKPMSIKSIDCPELGTAVIYIRGRQTHQDLKESVIRWSSSNSRDVYFDHVLQTLEALAKSPKNADIYIGIYKHVQLSLL